VPQIEFGRIGHLRKPPKLRLSHKDVVVEFASRHGLSERQRDLVEGAVRGLSSKEIAGALSIDYRTVAQHLARACEKVGAQDRHQLLARVIDLLMEKLNASAQSDPATRLK